MKVREAYIAYRITEIEKADIALNSPKRVMDYIEDAFSARPDQEQLWVILLDAKLKPLGRSCVFLGSLDHLTIHPREILRPALLAAAHSLIIAHNHPSGDPEPSPEDICMTGQLKDGCALIGIPLLDHLILGDSGRFYSFDSER